MSRDKVWRVVYDKTPPPPPHALDSPFRGKDKISIHEDTDGDGKFDKHKVFVDGLNLATSVAHGRGGIWVTNPPYLLFYPDANRDDIPDSPPEVHLSGFGIEDSHAVSNSLNWGPDGWLYGAQGSTVSAAIIRPGIDTGDEDAIKSMGQNIWRYHPERKIYEVFAEGGGNTFGVEIDSKGRVFSGHNGGDTRGFHYVQGGYYQKTFGKHGELSNPYTFGFFPAMKNAKVARFVHQFIIYESDGLPPRFHGNLLGVDVLHNNLVLSDLSPRGSTFETTDLARPIATHDKNFRPVHVVEAPDGSVFVADWYDDQVNHYRNHEGQIDHEMGRIYRVRKKGAQPELARNLGKLDLPALLDLLKSDRRWLRQTALRLLWDRGTTSDTAELHKDLIASADHPLENLWALAASGEIDPKAGLADPDPHIRIWTLRFIDDFGLFDEKIAKQLTALADTEKNVEVLSQLACTLRRIRGEASLQIAGRLATRSEATTDPHLPLLNWWAIESHCDTRPDEVVDITSGTSLAERVIRRLAMSGKQADLARCARLLSSENDQTKRNALIESLDTGLATAGINAIPPSLETELLRSKTWASLPIRVRQRAEGALDEALEALAGTTWSSRRRSVLAATISQLKDDRVAPALLAIAKDTDEDDNLRASVISSLSGLSHRSIASEILEHFNKLPPLAKSAAIDLLSSRRASAGALVAAVKAGRIPRTELSPAHVEKLRQLDPSLTDLWPIPVAATEREIARLRLIILQDGGIPKKGEAIFTQRCAACHKMFDQGGNVGPDLTSYQKNDLDTLLLSIADPGAEIREGYEQAILKLGDGALHSGFLTEQDRTSVSLRELSGAKRIIPRKKIDTLEIIGTSLMPAGLLTGLDDTHLRDLFAFLRSTTPPY